MCFFIMFNNFFLPSLIFDLTRRNLVKKKGTDGTEQGDHTQLASKRLKRLLSSFFLCLIISIFLRSLIFDLTSSTLV